MHSAPSLPPTALILDANRDEVRRVFAPLFAAWYCTHPSDPEAFELMADFEASDPYRRHLVVPLRGVRTSRIEAFFRFVRTRDDLSIRVARQCFLREIARRLSRGPADFKIPHEFAGGAGLWVAIVRDGHSAHVYAADHGELVDQAVSVQVATAWLQRAHDQTSLVG